MTALPNNIPGLPDILTKTSETLDFENAKRRPFDRFLLGPFMVWYGLKSRSMPRWPRRILIAGGIWQLVFGWQEYKRLVEASQESPKSILEVITNKELDL